MVMEKGRAGTSTRQLANRRYVAGAIIGLVGVSGILVLIFMSWNLRIKGIIGILLFASIILTMKFIAKVTEKEVDRFKGLENRAINGAMAEETVADILKQLSGDFAVFHDIKSPFGNIDHVVLNKNNEVFLIETKSHHGEITYNGSNLLINQKPPEKDFMSQVRDNTFWLRDEIKKQAAIEVFIKPVLVFTNAFVRVPDIKNMSVINKKYLFKTLTKMSGRKSSAQRDPGKPTLFVILQQLQKTLDNTSCKY